MATRTSVISERKVWFQQTRVWYTQSSISARRVRFLHAECNCETHTHNYDTHNCDVHTHSVMVTRTCVISEHKVWFQQTRVVIYTCRVRFPHAERYFYAQSVIAARSVILTRTNVIATLTTVIWTRTRVISTRKVWFWHVWVRLWHSKVWFTHARVEFQHDACDFNTNQLKLT
jgi:hypothetical protein